MYGNNNELPDLLATKLVLFPFGVVSASSCFISIVHCQTTM